MKLYCFPLHSSRTVCAPPPPTQPPPPPPLHVKLVPLIVRLVGLKLLITASRPPSSFQALSHWRRHGCLTRPRRSPHSLPSEEVPRRERQEGTSFTHPPHLPHPRPSPSITTLAPPSPPPRPATLLSIGCTLARTGGSRHDAAATQTNSGRSHRVSGRGGAGGGRGG